MNLDTVRHSMNVEPFEPIELRFANGDRHVVHHPDYMAVGKNVVMIAYPDSDRIAWCTPHQIVSIEKIVTPAEAGRNGS
ncbi:MAG: hypothetical protein WD851_05310 [Pirellulales bacterium]